MMLFDPEVGPSIKDRGREIMRDDCNSETKTKTEKNKTGFE
jgi:hypothetical protein